jgi:hypothetical protein
VVVSTVVRSVVVVAACVVEPSEVYNSEYFAVAVIVW